MFNVNLGTKIYSYCKSVIKFSWLPVCQEFFLAPLTDTSPISGFNNHLLTIMFGRTSNSLHVYEIWQTKRDKQWGKEFFNLFLRHSTTRGLQNDKTATLTATNAFTSTLKVIRIKFLPSIFVLLIVFYYSFAVSYFVSVDKVKNCWNKIYFAMYTINVLFLHSKSKYSYRKLAKRLQFFKQWLSISL